MARWDDDHRAFERPRRRTRPRTKDRPDYSLAPVAMVASIDRGRYRCLMDDGRAVSATKARILGRKGVIVGDRVRLDGDTSGADGTLGMSWLDPDARDAYIDRAELVEQEGLDAIADAWITSALAPRTHAHSPQLSGLTREMLERNDPASYAAACRAISKYQPIAHEDLGQPTLLLVGDHDRSTPVAMSEELHAAIPVTRIEVIPSAAHWAMLDQPDWISAKIMTWLL